MTQKMPLKLEADPIIDAVVEIRLNTTQALSDLLPGMLMQFFEESMGEVQRLPAANIPKQLRDNDPNLTYQYLVKIDLQGYSLFIGDRSIALACIMPYPSGQVFKAKVVDVFKKILALPVVGEVERFSIKYTDFIEGDQLSDLISYLNLSITAGQKNTGNFQALNLQFSSFDEPIINLVKIVALANLRNTSEKGQQIANSTVKKGLILEVNSIQNISNQNAVEFQNAFSKLLDQLHQSNKKQFFELLTPHALDELGANYAISN